MNFNFNQALADKGRRQDDALAVDRYNAETQRIAALRGGGGGGSMPTSKPEPAPNYSQIGNIASIATKNAYDTAYKPPISNPAPGVYGDSTSIMDQKPRLKEGGIIDSIKGILGVRKPAQNNDQAKDANRVANQTGGMVGGAAKALQSRQMRIEEELKRQGLRAGTEYVTDPTGNGSPTEDTVDANSSEYAAWAELMKGEVMKGQIFESEAKAFASRTDAYKTGKMQQFNTAIAKYDSELRGYSAEIDAEARKYGAYVQYFDSLIKGVSLDLDAQVKVAGFDLDKYRVQIQANIEEAKANVQLTQEEVRLSIAKLGEAGKIYSQLAASAMSAFNLSASASYSDGKSITNSLGESYSASV